MWCYWSFCGSIVTSLFFARKVTVFPILNGRKGSWKKEQKAQKNERRSSKTFLYPFTWWIRETKMSKKFQKIWIIQLCCYKISTLYQTPQDLLRCTVFENHWKTSHFINCHDVNETFSGAFHPQFCESLGMETIKEGSSRFSISVVLEWAFELISLVVVLWNWNLQSINFRFWEACRKVDRL